jgi:hypothetical protein
MTISEIVKIKSPDSLAAFDAIDATTLMAARFKVKKKELVRPLRALRRSAISTHSLYCSRIS